MLNFDIKKSCRKCFETNREFQPEEEFYSALIEVDETSTERRDYDSEHWNGPPENCLGWWKSRVPEQGKGRVYLAPKTTLIAFFEHSQASPQGNDLAYVTALLMVQKRFLTMSDHDDSSVLVVTDRDTNTCYEISIPDIEPQRLNEIQNELSDRLFMDQPEDLEAKDEEEV